MGNYFVFNVTPIVAVQVLQAVQQSDSIMLADDRCLGCTCSERVLGIIRRMEECEERYYAILSYHFATSHQFWYELNLPFDLKAAPMHEIDDAALETTQWWFDGVCQGLLYDRDSDDEPRPEIEDICVRLDMLDALMDFNRDCEQVESAFGVLALDRNWSDAAKEAAMRPLTCDRSVGLGTRLQAAYAAAEAVALREVAEEKAKAAKAQYFGPDRDFFLFDRVSKPAPKKPAALETSSKTEEEEN